MAVIPTAAGASLLKGRLGSSDLLPLAREVLRGGLRLPLARRYTLKSLGYGCDMLGRVAATATGNIDQSCARKIAEVTRHVLRSKIEPGLRQRIWQARIGVARDRHVGFLRKLLQKRIHQVRAQRAIETHGERLHMLHRVPKRLGGLRGDKRLTASPNRRRDHHRQFLTVLIEDLANG